MLHPAGLCVSLLYSLYLLIQFIDYLFNQFNQFNQTNLIDLINLINYYLFNLSLTTTLLRSLVNNKNKLTNF